MRLVPVIARHSPECAAMFAAASNAMASDYVAERAKQLVKTYAEVLRGTVGDREFVERAGDDAWPVVLAIARDIVVNVLVEAYVDCRATVDAAECRGLLQATAECLADAIAQIPLSLADVYERFAGTEEPLGGDAATVKARMLESVSQR